MAEGAPEISRGWRTANSPVAESLHPGAVVGGRFRLRRRLGRGLSGESWVAEDREGEGDCALKIAGFPGDPPDRWDALRHVLLEYRERMHTNEPAHTWD